MPYPLLLSRRKTTDKRSGGSPPPSPEKTGIKSKSVVRKQFKDDIRSTIRTLTLARCLRRRSPNPSRPLRLPVTSPYPCPTIFSPRKVIRRNISVHPYSDFLGIPKRARSLFCRLGLRVLHDKTYRAPTPPPSLPVSGLVLNIRLPTSLGNS